MILKGFQLLRMMFPAKRLYGWHLVLLLLLRETRADGSRKTQHAHHPVELLLTQKKHEIMMLKGAKQVRGFLTTSLPFLLRGILLQGRLQNEEALRAALVRLFRHGRALDSPCDEEFEAMRLLVLSQVEAGF